MKRELKLSEFILLLEINSTSHQREHQLIIKMEDYMCRYSVQKTIKYFVNLKYIYKSLGYCITDLGKNEIANKLAIIKRLENNY